MTLPTTPLTDAFTDVEELVHGLSAIAAPDGPLSKSFVDKSIATVTFLQGELQRTREALEKAYPLCIGWAAHWKHDHGNFAPEHLENLDDCAKALGLDILPSKALTPPTGAKP